MLSLFIDSKEYKVDWLEFSDGAITCKVIDLPISATHVSISVSSKTPCKVVIEELQMLYDAIRATLSCDVSLMMPYLPYARADRAFEYGNPNPLSVFLHQLLSQDMEFKDVYCSDIHNEKAISINYFPNIYSKPQLECLISSLPCNLPKYERWDAIISPDKGAISKAHSIAKFLKLPVVCAEKTRDVTTGWITDTYLPHIPCAKLHPRVLICDDIFDGGGTFIPLCEELKSRGCIVDLYITHFIGAKGLDILKGLVDNIYYYHTVGNYINDKHILDFNNGN
jgi:ribose-phosphate pyrophosphokinase